MYRRTGYNIVPIRSKMYMILQQYMILILVFFFICFKVGREETNERSEILQTLKKVEKQEAELKKELQKYRDSDPEYIAQLRNEIQVR